LGRSAPDNERAMRHVLVSLAWAMSEFGGSVAQAFAESGNRDVARERSLQTLQTETDQMVQARLALGDAPLG
jgi:hypothetical protein